MSVTIAVAGRGTMEIPDEAIVLGSEATCTVHFPESTGVKAKHAIIRSIAGRWLIETRDGDSIFVGGSEPKRMQWLNAGDEIRLTKQCPPIVFQPVAGQSSNDRPLIDSTPVIQSPPPKSRPLRDGSSHEIATADLSGVILPPDSDAAIPTAKPRSSATIPTRDADGTAGMKKSSSGSIPVRKGRTSTEIPIPKSRSSTEIPVPKSPSSASMRALKDSSGSIKSRSGSKSNAALRAITDDDADVPTLQRKSFNDEADDDLDYEFGSSKRKLTAEEQELRWVMTIVIRAVGAGVAIIIAWTIFSWVWKALSPTGIEASTQFQTTEIRQGVPRDCCQT